MTARIAVAVIKHRRHRCGLPLPVAPTKITRPAPWPMMSRRIGGSISSSNRGIDVLMVRMTMPTWFCWMKALQRKRPVPAGLTAKLHSLLRSNSAACLSFMIERARVRCAGQQLGFRTGWISPSILSAGGNPAVRKGRMLPLHHHHEQRIHEGSGLFAFHTMVFLSARARTTLRWDQANISPCLALRRASAGVIRLRRINSCRHWSSVCMPTEAGLDDQIHLCDLVFPDQVANRRRTEHDFVRQSARAVLGFQQRLRDYGDERPESIERVMSFSAGNTSTIRSMVFAADVCRCRTQMARSAAVRARRMVSRSRISPIRMMSGLHAVPTGSALANDRVCSPSSRWLIRHFLLFRARIRSGPSTVRM